VNILEVNQVTFKTNANIIQNNFRFYLPQL